MASASADILTQEFEGHDAVIDITSIPDPAVSIRLVDAAIAAGVRRFIPSEFSHSPSNAKARALSLWIGKNLVYQHITKLADEGKITFTSISNGGFVEFVLKTGMVGIDLTAKTVRLMNDGNVKFPWTSLPAIGEAIANALVNHEETKNQSYCIYSFLKSQQEVVELAKRAIGSEGWQTSTVDVNQAFEQAMGKVKLGAIDMEVIGDILRYTLSTPGYIQEVKKEDNEALGVKIWTDEEIIQVIKDVAGK